MRVSTALAEAARTARAQRVSSLMVAVLCAAICAVTLLTVGRTAAAEEQLLSRLDHAGSRLLVVTDDRSAGLVTPAVIQVLAGLDTVERVVGVDAPVDVTNSVIGEGAERVPAWRINGELAAAVTLTTGRWPQPGEALVAESAQSRLGFSQPAGAVTDVNGREYPVVGSYIARSPFEQFDAGLVLAGDETTPTRSVHVVVSHVEAVRVTETLVVHTLAPPDLSEITLQSPTGLADLQRVLGGDLGDYGRGLLLLTLGAGAVLVAVVVLAEVLLRRRDLGRRRALGASQWGLVGLVVARTVVAAVPGALLGAVGGAVIAVIWAQPPPLEFTCAVTVLTGLVSGIAAIPPAFLAAVRDPVGVLRTP